MKVKLLVDDEAGRFTVNEVVNCITSEPGDGTRYSYFVYRDGNDFCFMPKDNTFRYPQRLNYWGVKELDDLGVAILANDLRCNPCTLVECIRTMKEIME